MKFRKKGFENDFFKVVAYILLSIGIFKGGTASSLEKLQAKQKIK